MGSDAPRVAPNGGTQLTIRRLGGSGTMKLKSAGASRQRTRLPTWTGGAASPNLGSTTMRVPSMSTKWQRTPSTSTSGLPVGDQDSSSWST